ncbi:PrgI family protein [Candidatus Gottesmanbacteria bacterium]|nr:PrgI family protein [Candidatus Gottesmanbacteria bacterium]
MGLEQHPVPRNIIGFQFKLIGDMTLKQFGYLAGGAIIGYSIFKLLPLPQPITISLGLGVFATGFIFAFVPYQDRPFDQWITAFIKSVFSPTQFVYSKVNDPPDILLAKTTSKSVSTTPYHAKQYTDSKKMLDAYLARLPKQSSDYIDQNEKAYLAQTLGLFSQTFPGSGHLFKQKPKPQTQIPSTSPIIIEAQRQRPTPAPVHMVPKKPVKEEKEKELEKDTAQARMLAGELARLKEEMRKGSQSSNQNVQFEKRFLDLEQKLSTLLTERDRLTAEVAKLKNTQDLSLKAVKPKQAPEETTQIPTVTMISQSKANKVGLLNPPTTANIITGVIMDQSGATLPNILITVKDLRATPLRALKTNNLGQFFTSTPLANGTYVLEVEDPKKQFAFDLVELKLIGNIVQPLEISAKRKLDPIREELSKQLFQKTF